MSILLFVLPEELKTKDSLCYGECKKCFLFSVPYASLDYVVLLLLV